jgi:hypothetical protein
MSQKEFGGKTYYPEIGSVLINIRTLNYSDYYSREEKRNIVIGGEGVVFFDGLEVIDNGYKNNVIFVRISSWNDKSCSSDSQMVEAKSKQWPSFAGLYYYEATNLKLDNLVYLDDYTENINSTSKIYLDLYIDDQDIESIIQNYHNNNINGFSITIDFVNLLTDTPFNYPGGVMFIPPKENENFFNSVGVLKGLSFSFQNKFFDYVEPKGHRFSTIINEKSQKYYIENKNNSLFNKFDENISALNTHSNLITQIVNQLKKIEKLSIGIIIILILFLIYKVF